PWVQTFNHYKEKDFVNHFNAHSETQKRLNRPPGRTYGARYQPPAGKTQQASPSANPSRGDVGKKEEGEEEKQENDGSSLRSLEDQGKDAAARVSDILDKFPPFDLDDVAFSPRAEPNIKCHNCNFKFSTIEERDEHHLSVYCKGSHIVAYCLSIDSSQPRGYKVEKKLVPLDGRMHPPFSNAGNATIYIRRKRKRMSMRKTHPLVPSRCLHCNKIFSTMYELEDHYDWHDDMEFRNKTEKTILEKNESQSKKPEIVTNEIFELGQGTGILMRPLPFSVGTNGNRLYPDKTLAAISYISSEDAEMHIAPNGFPSPIPTHYISIPRGLSFDGVAERMAALDGSSEPKQLWGYEKPLDIAAASQHSGASFGGLKVFGPPGCQRDFTTKIPLQIFGHGRPGLFLATDVFGRRRWLRAPAEAEILKHCMGESISKAVKEEDGAIQLGKIVNPRQDRILDAYIRAFDSLSATAEEESKFLLAAKIGLLAAKIDRFNQAVEFYCTAITLSRKLYGRQHINIFTLINELAVLHENKGLDLDAASLYRRSLTGRLAHHGLAHADVFMTMQELGTVNIRMKNYPAARMLLEKAYIGYENLSPPDERMTLLTPSNLASTFLAMGWDDDARLILEPAIPRMSVCLGLKDSVLAHAICNLLQCLRGPDISAEVRGILDQYEEADWEPAMDALRCFANFLASRRRLGESERLYRKVFEWRKSRFGNSDPQVVETLYSAGTCLYRLQRLEEALNDFDEVVRLAKSLLGQQALLSSAERMAAATQQHLKRLREEDTLWAAGTSGPCVCKQIASQRCPVCKIQRICSPRCSAIHKAQRDCCPSVIPVQSRSVVRMAYSAYELEAQMRDVFTQDPLVLGTPTLVSSEA
ncbi:hypothetical protein B0T18DRAFT_168367, partial [Schizothecium vesticola]